MIFLHHAWLVPLIPAVSYVLILFFGKRLPKKGSEIGLLAVGTSFVLSCGALVQWIGHADDSESGGGGEHALGVIGTLGRSIGRIAQEGGGGGEHHVLPILNIPKTWFDFGGLKLTAGIQVDGLAVLMMFVVTLISFLVHIYSLEYMRNDRRFTHYYASLSLFTASMLLLVVADNTLMMLIGWELVGLCSFMLIGHWWEDKANSRAAIKAFLTTRTGDIGLLTGVIMTFFVAKAISPTNTGTFNIQAVNTAANSGKVSHTLLLWCALALLLGIMGKSGQFPLHTWLPDAMAGPTPVSALIHAATMVVAGVYLGARLYPVFWHGLSIGTPGHGGVNAMAVIGGITILIGATLAFVQDDIKKVLAYSTISQLGYMTMALGVGAWTAAVFHLFTHAFFKADLFLGAGSVSHSGAHHSFDMKKDMGGLRKYMPQTFITFIVGSIALAGIFPFAGFWSKDEILANAGNNGYLAFTIVGLAGAFLTAAYMTRCVYLTFFGEYRGGAHLDAHGEDPDSVHLDADSHAHDTVHHGEPHESNWLITGPLWVLTAFAAFIGFINAPFLDTKFEHWFEPKDLTGFEEVLRNTSFNFALAGISIAAALIGFGLAWSFYTGRLKAFEGLSARNGVARVGKMILVNKYYIDWLYEDVIVAGIRGPIAAGVYWFNQHIIDNVLNFTGRGTAALGRWTYKYIDQKGVDGIVNGIGQVTSEGGGELRKLQTGRLQFYALMLVAAVAVFAIVLWVFT